MKKDLLDLLIELNTAITEYDFALSDLKRYYNWKNESKDDFRYQDLKRRLDEAEERIESIYRNIDKYFKEGYYAEISEDVAEAISDEYLELINHLDPVTFMIKSKTFQKFEDLTKFYYDTLIPGFERLKENIRQYNKVARNNHWNFQIISPEEAEIKYGRMRSLIRENRIKEVY